MTPEEIRESSEQSKTQVGWLREIAYQLAMLNELGVASSIRLERASPELFSKQNGRYPSPAEPSDVRQDSNLHSRPRKHRNTQ